MRENSVQSSTARIISSLEWPRESRFSTSSLPDCAPKWSLVLEQYRSMRESDSSQINSVAPHWGKCRNRSHASAVKKGVQFFPTVDESHQSRKQMHSATRSGHVRTGSHIQQWYQLNGGACNGRRYVASGSNHRRTDNRG